MITSLNIFDDDSEGDSDDEEEEAEESTGFSNSSKMIDSLETTPTGEGQEDEKEDGESVPDLEEN